MDHRRVLIALLFAPSLALAAQAGPVYTSSPPYPTTGAACSIGRVQIQRDSGKRWCCAAGTWAACGELVDDGTNLVASKPVSAPSITLKGLKYGVPGTGIVVPDGPLLINRQDTSAYFPAIVLRNGVAGVPNVETQPGAEIRFEGIDPSGAVIVTAYLESKNDTATNTADLTLIPNCGLASCAGGLHVRMAGILDASEGVTIGPLFAQGTLISGSYRATTTVDLASIPANSCVSTAVAVTGAAVGAECSVGMPAASSAGLSWGCYVSATGTVQLRTCNVTTAAVDPVLATYSVRVWNP